MSVVRINVLEVPDEMASVLAERFANRAKEIDQVEGFEGFELLKPTDGSNRWYVYTRWADEASFQAWVESAAFTKGHAQSAQHGPAASGSDLLAFDVVITA